MSRVSGIVSTNREDSEAFGPSWRTSKASDAMLSDEVTGRKNRTGARGANNSIRLQGTGRRHGNRLANRNLENGRD